MFLCPRFYFLPLLLLLLLCSSCEGIKVISTDPEAFFLPDKSGQAIILNSSLQDLSEWSLCGRFKTFHFSSHEDTTPFQSVIASGGLWMLSGFTVVPCHTDHQEVQTDRQILMTNYSFDGTLGFLVAYSNESVSQLQRSKISSSPPPSTIKTVLVICNLGFGIEAKSEMFKVLNDYVLFI